MAKTLPSSETILRRLEPAIKQVEDNLRSALAEKQGDAGLSLALSSVGLLHGFLEKIIERVANQDIVERAAVYSLVTEHCAVFINRPFGLVYPAVLALCEETDPNLLDGVDEPEPGIVDSLRSALLKVSVTYELKVGDRAERCVQLYLHEAVERQVREQKDITELPWEEIPEDVREMSIRDGQGTVVFTLYPRDEQ
jgi:hypothetical protein